MCGFIVMFVWLDFFLLYIMVFATYSSLVCLSGLYFLVVFVLHNGVCLTGLCCFILDRVVAHYVLFGIGHCCFSGIFV